MYYHKLGTKQKADKIIFGKSTGEKHRYVWGTVTEDDKYLFISGAESTSGNRLFYIDLTKPEAQLKTIIKDTDNDTGLLLNNNDTFYLVTNLNAPNKRLVKVEADKPSPENWKDVIPETKNVLSVTKGANHIFAHYMVDAVSAVKQYDLEGKLVRDITLPGVGSISGFSGKLDDTSLYFSFTNYTTAGNIYSFNPKDGSSELHRKSKIDFNSDKYESKQVFYKSLDGTKIPMIITHKKGIKLNGENPTILYGYGGFNVSLTPSFSIANAVWMELGGVYAVPNIRGGGEYGKEWHNAGTQLKNKMYLTIL